MRQIRLSNVARAGSIAGVLPVIKAHAGLPLILPPLHASSPQDGTVGYKA